MTTNKTEKKQNKKSSSFFSKSDDGSIQITFTFASGIIEKERANTLKEISKDVEIAGFRRGMAPLDKVEEKVGRDAIYEKILNKILPPELSEAFKTHNIKPIVYPKVELLNSKAGEDWQVRITTCELPEVDLGEYKKAISDKAKSQSIWTPDKGKPDKKEEQEPSTSEKESLVVNTLLNTVHIKIPKPLMDEEVNHRLSRMLEQIEKLGLTLESYLTSIGKNAESLRKDYEKEASDSIKIELALNKIAEIENVKVNDEDIDAAIKATYADPQIAQKMNNPQQRRAISAVLKRRGALNSLVNLMG